MVEVVEHFRSQDREDVRCNPAALPHSVTLTESMKTFLSPFQRAADVVDLLGILAARRRGGGDGEPAGLDLI